MRLESVEGGERVRGYWFFPDIRPIGKVNRDGYMHEFVRRYASFFRIAGLRLEFERLVMVCSKTMGY
jgi:hypothetical protein